MAVAESRLSEIDALIEEAESEIESLRSREQSGPLQKGCAFFGLFMTVIIVIAVFMLLGRSYVGSWPFFLSVAVVILLSLARMRRKLVRPAQLEELRQDRMQIEEGLAQLQAERGRVQKLKATVSPEEPTTE